MVASVDEGAGGPTGLAETSGVNERGLRIEGAGVDAAGIGISIL